MPFPRSRQPDVRRSFSAPECPEPIQRFDSVNTRQLDVHQKERRLSLVGKAHAFFTGLGHDSLITLDLQRIPHELQVLGIVFDDEDELIRHGAPGS
jgi:hypothetical protein